jgi:mRNA interferase MazF
MVTYTPKRGDIVWINFTPQKAHEQAGKRPPFVVSPQKYNKVTGLMLCCPITSKQKGYPFEVALKDLPIKGVILCDQVKSLDFQARGVQLACEVKDEALVKEVISFIKLLLEE